jgi:hypothetical protein
MIKDFWTTNLNPVTMMSRELDYSKNKAIAKQKELTYKTADLSENPEYIAKSLAIKTLGIGAKKIKQGIQDKGLEFISYISRGIQYYKFCDIDAIDIVIASKLIIPDDYISSTELKAHLGLDTMQLWTLAHKNKWKKKKFHKNVSYFLKSEVLN